MRKRIFGLVVLLLVSLMSVSVNAADIASGREYEPAPGHEYSGAEWRLDDTGTLYVSAPGPAFLYYVGAPWYEYEPQIHHIIFEEGVTVISNMIFTLPKYEDLTISLPASLTWIGFPGDGSNNNYVGSQREEHELIDEWGLSDDVTFIVKPGTYAEDYVKRMGYKISYDSSAAPQAPEVSPPTQAPVEEPSAPDTVTTSFGATVSSWAAPEIELAFENDLIPEVMLNFDLTKKVNRGEFAAIALQLYETLTSSEVSLPKNCSFADISGDIYEQAIKKAYGIQITDGTSATTFEPIRFITREQLATMLCRVIKKYGFKDWTLETDGDYYMNTDGAKKFADDADISDWAKPSVYYMSLHGIIYGIDDTHFAPKNTTTQQEASGYATATREQAILLAQRIFTKSDMLGN